VHELLQGASIFPEQPVSNQTPEFRAYLEMAKKRMDDREYEKAAGSMSFNKKDPDNVASTMREGGTRAVAFGMNVIVLMATGFAFFYFVGRALGFEGAGPILMGALGLVLAMLLETVLFVVREEGALKHTDIRTKREKYQEDRTLDQLQAKLTRKRKPTVAAPSVAPSQPRFFSKFDLSAEPAMPAKID